MINLTMTWWELALIIIALAIVVGTYFLIRLLKDLNKTVGNVNSLLDDNKRSIDSIITNVDGITKDAELLTDKADSIANELTDTVATVKTDIVNPLLKVLIALVKVLQTATTKK